MRIFLIGYMGSGKSTIGKKLAGKLKANFIDLDRYIEEKSGKTISGIFASQGEEAFRAMERKYLSEVASMESTVISLGGGTPCFNRNMELINASGISIYLDASVDVLIPRLIKGQSKRPLIQGMNEAELRIYIEANLKKRIPYYTQARFTVKSEGGSVDDVAERLKNLVLENTQ